MGLKVVLHYEAVFPSTYFDKSDYEGLKQEEWSADDMAREMFREDPIDCFDVLLSKTTDGFTDYTVLVQSAEWSD